MKLVNICKLFLISLSIFMVSPAGAVQVCTVRLDCPGNYHNDTVQVGRNVIALNNTFFHCAPDSINELLPGNNPDTISVFFLIDHSGSMSIMDSNAIRYKVVNQIIDSIYTHSPASEIGLAVFSNQLLHSYNDDSYYVQLDPRWHDSYIPLTKLTETVNGISAVQKLKQSIQLSSEKDYLGNYKLVNGNYSATGRKDSLGNNNGYNGTTDISLAFEAAKKAFSSTARPKEKQFVVLLSDGISQNIDIERKPYELDYIAGVNVPTTFTAYFINERQPIPQQIITMTDNIASNNYSQKNTDSKEWKTMGRESELLNDLLGKISSGGGLGYYLSTPENLTINGIVTDHFDDSLAFMPQLIPLTGKYTELNISFKVHWDLPINKDETRTYSTIIMQSDTPDDLEDSCYDQGSLNFYYQGSRISYIETQQKTIEVRFFPPEGFTSSTVDITIYSRENSDFIVLHASRVGEYFSAQFDREYGTPIKDQILQNAFVDSVIAVYRNPDLPLDTVRIAAKVFEPRDIAVRSACYLDTNANGYPDIIRVTQGSEKLSAQEDSLIKAGISILTPRTLFIRDVVPGPSGFDILLNESVSGVPFTGVFPDERLYIDKVTNLPGGGELPQTEIVINDSMAPVVIGGTYFDHSERSITDTFEVVFSEKIKPFSEQQPFLLSSISQNIDYKLRLTHLKDDSVSLFSVNPMIGIPDPGKGDSINIVSTAGINDRFSNDQNNEENIRRAIQYYLLYALSGAAYFDTTGDGLIDLVKVYMPVAPDSALFDHLFETISLPSYRNFTYDEDDLALTSNGFVIHVKQPPGTEPYTATDSRDILSVSYTLASNGSMIKPVSVPVSDSIAPVLIEAIYIPKSGNNNNETDSIKARLSENIAIPSNRQPFTFFDPATGQKYSMDLEYSRQENQSTYVFSIIDIIGKEYPQAGDSVSINPGAGVRDQIGNIQDSENKFSELKFKTQQYDFLIVSYPNPFDPKKSEIPPKVINHYGLRENKGILIIAEPTSQMAGYVDLEGKMVIYDAVGGKINEISGNTPKTGKGVIFLWNGQNQKGRTVGTGTYLTVITLKDSQGYRIVKKHKIGVRRFIHTDNYFSFEHH